jgi:hypothetical protein
MGWDDEDYEYANGADGSCQECGEDTDEPWHLLCRRCYAKEQGWTTGDDDEAQDGVMPAPAFPGDERWRVAYMKGYREGWAAAKADMAA